MLISQRRKRLAQAKWGILIVLTVIIITPKFDISEVTLPLLTEAVAGEAP